MMDGPVQLHASWAWIIDTVAPTTQFALVPGAVTDTTRADFRLTCTGCIDYECNVDGGGWTSKGIKFSQPGEGAEIILQSLSAGEVLCDSQ